MSLYLHAPTRSDPSLAPPGCETFYVLSPVPNLAATSTGPRCGTGTATRSTTGLERTCVPDLRRHLVTERVLTPEYFHTELWSHLGAAFSFEPRLLQSAYFRGHNRCPDVPNLYFVGAGTHPGAGIPGVLTSARVTDSLIPVAPDAAMRPRERRAVAG
jgi:phytoene desaturase